MGITRVAVRFSLNTLTYSITQWLRMQVTDFFIDKCVPDSVKNAAANNSTPLMRTIAQPLMPMFFFMSGGLIMMGIARGIEWYTEKQAFNNLIGAHTQVDDPLIEINTADAAAEAIGLEADHAEDREYAWQEAGHMKYFLPIRALSIGTVAALTFKYDPLKVAENRSLIASAGNQLAIEIYEGAQRKMHWPPIPRNMWNL